MSKFVRGVLTLLFLSLALPALRAQTVSSSGGQEQAARTSILIGRQLVRFSVPEAQEWRLEVSDQQGQVIFDTGFLYGVTLEWPMLNQQGETVAGGLYIYSLTIKNATTGETRTQRGHVILSRAGSANDQVWVTSDNAVSLGAEGQQARLTVVGNGETTVGGAELPGVVPRREVSAERPESPKRASDEVATAKAAAPAVVNGTVNRVAKFAADGVNLVDTQVSEANGAMVVGNASATGNLQIFGQAGQDVFAGMGPDVINGPAFNYGYAGASFGRSAGFFNVRPDASAVAPNPSLRFLTANQQRMIITNTGNVGIGTTNPSAKLTISGTGAYNATGAPRFDLFNTVAGTGFLQHVTDSGLWQIASTSGATRMVIDTLGSVGIGTISPILGKLHVYDSNSGTAVYGTSAVSGGGITSGGIGVYGDTQAIDGVGVWGKNGFGGWAMYAEGNTSQQRNKGGWVKALLKVTAAGGIERCYNAITGSAGGTCGFSVSVPDPNHPERYNINFGFKVDDRFVSVTTDVGFASAAFASVIYNFGHENIIRIHISPAEAFAFTVIVY